MTYPQGLSAGRGEPADGSFTIIFRQDLAIRQRTFLAFLSAWMIVNANSSSHSSCRCAWSRVPFKRHTAASPKKLPATVSVAGSDEQVVKEKRAQRAGRYGGGYRPIGTPAGDQNLLEAGSPRSW